MSKNKREHDRHSGTGGSIKADAKKSGAGQHNWGGADEAIVDAVVEHKETEAAAVAAATAPTVNPAAQATKADDLNPENYAELQEAVPLKEDLSYEEFMKEQKRSNNKAYDARTVNSSFRVNRYKGKNQQEKATDELLEGVQKEKKKERNQVKRKLLLKLNIPFILPVDLNVNVEKVVVVAVAVVVVAEMVKVDMVEIVQVMERTVLVVAMEDLVVVDVVVAMMSSPEREMSSPERERKTHRPITKDHNHNTEKKKQLICLWRKTIVIKRQTNHPKKPLLIIKKKERNKQTYQ